MGTEQRCPCMGDPEVCPCNFGDKPTDSTVTIIECHRGEGRCQAIAFGFGFLIGCVPFAAYLFLVIR